MFNKLIYLVLLAGTLIALIGCSQAQQNTSLPPPPSGTVSGTGTSAKVISAGGIILSLSLNSATYLSGQEVQIYIDEQNPASDSVTVPAAKDWPVSGLAVGP